MDFDRPSATFTHSSTDLVVRTLSGIDFQAFQHIPMTGFQCRSPNTVCTNSESGLKEHNRGVIVIYKILPEDNLTRFILALNRPKKVRITRYLQNESIRIIQIFKFVL